jgi:hypothetical protein
VLSPVPYGIQWLPVSFQVPYQSVEYLLILIMVLPRAEIGDVVRSDVSRQVSSSIGVEAFPALNGTKCGQTDGEKHVSLLLSLLFKGSNNLSLYPVACYAGLREDEQKPVVDTDSLIDLLVYLFATLDIMRGKPATGHLPIAVMGCRRQEMPMQTKLIVQIDTDRGPQGLGI